MNMGSCTFSWPQHGIDHDTIKRTLLVCLIEKAIADAKCAVSRLCSSVYALPETASVCVALICPDEFYYEDDPRKKLAGTSFNTVFIMLVGIVDLLFGAYALVCFNFYAVSSPRSGVES